MIERELRPRGPYSLALTARGTSDATRTWRDGVFTTALRAGGRIETAAAWQRPDGTLVLRAESEAGIDHVRFVLAAEADHTPFLRRFAGDPYVGTAIRRLRGLRQARVGTVAQALLRAFCGQLIESKRAWRLEGRIVRALTPALPGTRLHAPPTGACLAGLSPAALRAHGLHASRGAALVRICRSLDPERLRELPTDAVAERLERERGIGPWSTGLVLLEGLGRTERGLVGDLGLVKLLSALRGRRVEAWETAELLEPYGEWAGLAGVYLLRSFALGYLPVPSRAAA